MTREHFDNLKILRAHLITYNAVISPGLDFEVYESESESADQCQTVGCIIGHATYIPEFAKYIKINEKGRKNYGAFGEDVFGIPVYSSKYECNPIWLELFGDTNPNSIEAFIDRLDEYLNKTGVTK